MLAELALAFAASSCFAPHADWMALHAGSGDAVEISGLGWEIPMIDDCDRSSRLRRGLLVRVDEWRGRNAGGRQLLDVSVTPFLRYELGRPLHIPLYAEGGIGVNLLSRTRVDAERQFSTAYQFGEFIGVAARYGPRGQSQVGVRFQHVSNGGIKRPNDGLTYGMIYFNQRF